MEIRVDTLDKAKPIPLHVTHDGDMFIGEAQPIRDSFQNGMAEELAIELNGVQLGTIRFTPKGWRMDAHLDQQMVDVIGHTISEWYK